jgi:hypothetical protein
LVPHIEEEALTGQGADMTALELSAKPQILENPKPATVGIMSEIGENPNALSRDLGVYVSKTVFD